MISFCGQKGCALAVAGVPWDLTVAPGLLENLSFHRTLLWALWISQVQSTGSIQLFIEYSLDGACITEICLYPFHTYL